MTIGDRLKALRSKHKLTLEEVSKYIKVSRQTINRYENNIITNIPSDRIEMLAALFETTPAHLMGWEDDVPMDKSDAALPPIPNAKGVKKIRLPKLGVTAAGEPTFAEYSDEYVEVDFDIKADFALDVKGDSMYPDIQNGDIVFVRSQPEARNGQIAIIMIDGEVTVKVFYKDAHAITLMPKNAAYPPTIITNADGRDVRILGVVVRSCRNYV